MASKVILKPSYYRKINKLIKSTGKYSMETVKELGNMGKRYAKSIAPRYSGKTANAIRKRTKNKADGPEAIIFISPQQPQDGRKRNIADFDLVRWMHTSNRAQRHIKSGSRQFFYRTAEYLNLVRKGTAQKNFDKIKIK